MRKQAPLNAAWLLEHLQLPSVLIEQEYTSIIAVNEPFVQLIGENKESLIGRNIETLSVLKKVKNTVNFAAHTIEIGSYSLICLDQDLISVSADDPKRVIDQVGEFSRCENEHQVKSALSHAIQMLIPSAITVTYERKDEISSEYILDTNTEGFPEKIACIEGERIEKIDIWISGRRVINVIHRFARDKYLSCVITIKISGADNKEFLSVSALSDIPANFERITDSLKEFIKLSEERLLYIYRFRKTTNDLQETKTNYEALKRLCDLANLGLISIDEEQNVRSINLAACTILGYSSLEASGKNFDNLIGFIPKLNKTMIENANRIESQKIIGTMHRKNGEKIPVTLWIYTPNDHNKDLLCSWIAFTNDSTISELKSQTKELQHQAEIGKLIASFSHEARNPINNIATGLQVLALRNKDNPNSLATINRMQSDCIRTTDLFESILIYTRPFNVIMERISINEIINRVVDKYFNTTKNPNITIHTDLKRSEKTQVLADSRSLEQVFTNLIANSIEAFREKIGRIGINSQINAIDGKSFLEIRIADNGPGIPQEIIQKLFEPFATSKEKGTGLGLAITKKILDSHQAEISVQSFPGGTIFLIVFPILDTEDSGGVS